MRLGVYTCLLSIIIICSHKLTTAVKRYRCVINLGITLFSLFLEIEIDSQNLIVRENLSTLFLCFIEFDLVEFIKPSIVHTNLLNLLLYIQIFIELLSV